MIICGDCVEVMAGMPENHFDAIVTDPPYQIGFMSKAWDKNGISFQIETWAECLRIAKPGCHLLAFGGTRTFHRLTCALEDAGWEIRDTLMWVYGSGFPKSHNLKGDWQGWGTAMKPAWEPIILARKPLDGTVAENVQKWGTGAINVDGCRIGLVGTENLNAKQRTNNLSKVKYFDQERRNFKEPIQTYKANGRWPANLIHDGSEEVLELFPNNISAKGQCKYVGTDNNRGVERGGIAKQGHEVIWEGKGDSGSAARFFYCAKASRAEREMGLEGMETRPSQKMGDGLKSMVGHPSGNQGNTSTEDRRSKNPHPTVKPLALMCYLCQLVTPPDGLILDPFVGSGTTGMAAKAEGFRFIGIDNDLEYCKIAKKRIES